MRHVGEHLAPQAIDGAQRLVACGQFHRHPVERASHMRDLVAAGFRRAGRQVAGAQSLGRGRQRLQAAPRRREDECGGDDGGDRKQRGSRDGEQPADIAHDRTSGGHPRQHHHAVQHAVHLDRRHHHRRPLERRLLPAGNALDPEQRAGGSPQVVGERLAAVGHDPPVLHHEIQRLNLGVLAVDELLEIDLCILRERRADVRGDDGGDRVRRPQRKRAPPGHDVAEDGALRREHRDHEDDKAEADPEIEAAIPAWPL